MSNYNDNNEKDNGMPEVPEVAKKTGRKIGNKAKKAMKKSSRKIVGKMTKILMKIIIKLLMIAIKILIMILPYLLIFLVAVLIIYIAWSTIFNTRGITQNKQTEDATEYNTLTKDENSGDYIASDVSTGNKVVNAFYTYFSLKSIWCSITDEDGNILQKEPIQYNGTEFQKNYGDASTTPVKDKYGRETKFYLNPDALWTLDEFLNKSKFRFPEQFIQPVYHDPETNELKEIENDDGELMPESTSYKYNSDGKLVKDGDNKEKGVWDYGFGSIINYQGFKEEHKAVGNYVYTEVWNKEKQSIEKVSIAELNSNGGTNGFEGYESDELNPSKKYTENFAPTHSYMIDKVTSPAGSIENKIKFEWEDSGTPYAKTTERKVKVSVKVKNSCNTDDDDDSDSSSSNSKDCGWHYEQEEITLHSYIEGTHLDKIPKYDGEPDLSKITGDKYYKDYITHYKTYIPEDVMGNLGISELKNRTGHDQEELLKLLQRQPFKTSSTITSDSDFTDGQGANQDNVAKLAQYENEIQNYSSSMGVDPDFIKAVILQESGGNINANNSGYGFGLMQLEMTQYEGKPMTIQYLDGSKEVITPTRENMKNNVDMQLKCGIQELRNSSKLFEYNLYAGMSGYNFGQGGEQYILKTYISQRDGISLSEAKSKISELLKSGDNGWMNLRSWYSTQGYREINADGGGDPQYVEHIMRYYPSDKVPYIVDEDGNKISMDGSIQAGFATVGNSSNPLNSINNWIKSSWQKLQNEWSKLFPNMTEELSPNKMYYEHQPDEHETDTIIKMMTAMSQHKKLSDLESLTTEDWKNLYYLWFTNPLGEPWSQPSKVGMNEYFSNGFASPLDFKPLTISNTESYDPEHYHLGIDIVAPKGSSVFSMDDGVVTYVNEEYKWFTRRTGKYIIIKNSLGTEITYGSLASIDVKTGDKVSKGEQIGTSGNTEDILKDVLHIEIKKNNKTVDPAFIITGGGATLTGYNLSSDDKAIIQSVLNYAESAIGKPYSNDNREGPNSFDCSGHVWWSYWKGTGGQGNSESSGGGISIGHVTTGIAQTLANYKIDIKNGLQPGDLIGWNMEQSGNGAHVSIVTNIDTDGTIHTISAGNGNVHRGTATIGYGYSQYNQAYRPIAYIRDKLNGKI